MCSFVQVLGVEVGTRRALPVEFEVRCSCEFFSLGIIRRQNGDRG